MSELRHSRPMIRHHRQRLIRKRSKLYSWLFDWSDVKGKLSKFHETNHNNCKYLSRKYKRERFNWKQDLENGP